MIKKKLFKESVKNVIKWFEMSQYSAINAV